MTKDKEFLNELLAFDGPVNFPAKIFTSKKSKREREREKEREIEKE